MTRQQAVVLLWVILAWSVAPLPGHAATLRVPGDHKTIQAALNAAVAGDVVLVGPGTYRETVRLKKGVVLRSAGDDGKGKVGLVRAEKTILEGEGDKAPGPAVVLADDATLDGFSVTRVGRFDQKQFDEHARTRGENLADEHGILGPGKGFPAVEVVSSCRVINNIVHDNGHPGIGCRGAAKGAMAALIEQNVVFRNMGGGIALADGAAPLVRGNRCFQNLRAGIGIRNARPLVVGNECFENVRAGIGIREGAAPTVRGNKCHNNRRAGIGCRMADTAPLLEENECYRNGMAGIGSRDGARPLISRNKCYRNALAGIGLDGEGRAVILDNECYENEQAGIGLRGGSGSLLKGNHVHHNKAAGIGFSSVKDASATVLANKVRDNAQVGIGVHSGWKVRLVGNGVSRQTGLPPLVMVFAQAEVDLLENDFRSTGVAGVRAEGKVRACNNRFTSAGLRKVGPPQFAIWALPGSSVLLWDNQFQGWRQALSAEKAEVVARSNTVSEYWQAGFRIDQPSQPPVVTDNLFRSAAGHDGVVLTGGTGSLRNNRVEKGKGK